MMKICFRSQSLSKGITSGIVYVRYSMLVQEIIARRVRLSLINNRKFLHGPFTRTEHALVNQHRTDRNDIIK